MNENNIKALFPEGVEKITISKNDYDRLFGQLTYENIVLQSKIDKARKIIDRYSRVVDYDDEVSIDVLYEIDDILKEDK